MVACSSAGGTVGEYFGRRGGGTLYGIYSLISPVQQRFLWALCILHQGVVFKPGYCAI